MRSSSEALSWRGQSVADATLKTVSAPGFIHFLYLLLCCFSIIPFVAVAYPPIADFADHAARLAIACHSGDAAFAAMYSYRLGIIPNLVIDLVNIPMCGTAAPSTVLKLVTAASLAIIYLSAWLLQRRLFGEVNAFLLMLPAMAFNLATTMGYINFFAGIAAMMALVALITKRRLRFPMLLIICNLAGVAIFFCHVFALAITTVVFFGLNLRQRSLSFQAVAESATRTAGQFLVPLAMLALVPTAGHHLAIAYEGKLRTLVALFMAQQDNIGLYGILLAIPLYLLVRNRLVAIEPHLRAPLVLLAIYVLVVPNQISDAIDIDSRTFVALAYLLFTGLRPVRRTGEISLALVLISVFYAILQLQVMVSVWQPFSGQVHEFRSSVSSLPPRARVFSVADDRPGPRQLALPMAYAHVTSYATIERRIFNPLEFTGVGMQPMSARPPFAKLDTPAGMPLSPDAARKLASPTARTVAQAREYEAAYALSWPSRFDYVVYYHFGNSRNFDPANLELIHEGSFFSILKVRIPDRGASPSDPESAGLRT